MEEFTSSKPWAKRILGKEIKKPSAWKFIRKAKSLSFILQAASLKPKFYQSMVFKPCSKQRSDKFAFDPVRQTYSQSISSTKGTRINPKKWVSILDFIVTQNELTKFSQLCNATRVKSDTSSQMKPFIQTKPPVLDHTLVTGQHTDICVRMELGPDLRTRSNYQPNKARRSLLSW